MKLFWLGTVVGVFFVLFLACALFTVFTIINKVNGKDDRDEHIIDEIVSLFGGSMDKITSVMESKVSNSVRNEFNNLFNDWKDETIAIDSSDLKKELFSDELKHSAECTEEDIFKEFESYGIASVDNDATVVLEAK